MPAVAGRQSRWMATASAPGTAASIRIRPSIGWKSMRSGMLVVSSCTTPL